MIAQRLRILLTGCIALAGTAAWAQSFPIAMPPGISKYAGVRPALLLTPNGVLIVHELADTRQLVTTSSPDLATWTTTAPVEGLAPSLAWNPAEGKAHLAYSVQGGPRSKRSKLVWSGGGWTTESTADIDPQAAYPSSGTVAVAYYAPVPPSPTGTFQEKIGYVAGVPSAENPASEVFNLKLATRDGGAMAWTTSVLDSVPGSCFLDNYGSVLTRIRKWTQEAQVGYTVTINAPDPKLNDSEVRLAIEAGGAWYAVPIMRGLGREGGLLAMEVDLGGGATHGTTHLLARLAPNDGSPDGVLYATMGEWQPLIFHFDGRYKPEPQGTAFTMKLDYSTTPPQPVIAYSGGQGALKIARWNSGTGTWGTVTNVAVGYPTDWFMQPSLVVRGDGKVALAFHNYMKKQLFFYWQP